ncbi:MAG: leucine-rich repeat domain-containing protein [Chitinophagales bacterium]
MYSQNNDIDALDFTGTPNIIELNCSSNNLVTIDVSGLVNLEILDCSNNQLSKLDLRNSPFINDIVCDSESDL